MNLKSKIKSVNYFTVLFILCLAANIKAQEVPFLLSPPNNSKYVKTQKLTLDWLKVIGAQAYQVQVASSSDFLPSTLVLNLKRNSESAVVSDLNNNTIYWWRVRVDNDSASWSDTWKFTTTIPPRPVNLISPSDGIANLKTDVIIFEWSKDSANASFNLQISSDPDFIDTLRNITVSSTKTELTNLSSGMHYYWRIKPYNIDYFPGNWSEVFNFRTQLRKTFLQFPGNFSNNQDTAITFRWTKVALASIYDFQLSYSIEFEKQDLISDSATTFNEIKIKSLINDTTYYWRVKARNTFADTSSWTEPFIFKTKIPKPILISPANKSRNHENRVELQWTAGNPFERFRVQVATDSNFTKLFSNSFTENNRTTLLNLDYNKRYYWRVNVKNGDGDSSYWSKFYEFKTKLKTPKLDIPITNSTHAWYNLDFAWHPVDSAEFYIFNLSDNYAFSNVIVDDMPEDTTLQLDSLEIGKTFFWKVKAINSFGDSSEWSITNYFNTSVIRFSTLEIDTAINFSVNRTDTITSVDIYNNSQNEVSIAEVFAAPDTLFFTDKGALTIDPNSFQRIYVFADTSKITTGLFDGEINFVRELDGTDDTTKITFTLLAKKAIAGFSIDSLQFDTTLSYSPKTLTARLSNRLGNITLLVDKMYLEGRDSASFEILNEIKKVNAGDSSAINIKFDPLKLDTNKVSIVFITNSYPEKIVRLPLLGFGKGGVLDNKTINILDTLKSEPLNSLVESTRELVIRNEGNLPLEYTISFTENYFRFVDAIAGNFKIPSKDSVTLELQYITPNFDSLNIDTLILKHNGIGEKTFKFLVKGIFDSASVANEIISKLRIEEKTISQITNEFVVPENTSIQARLTSDIFENETNLNFELNYFNGGPGTKSSSLETSTTRFVIPYQKVNKSGLAITGQLFTRDATKSPVDSLTVFDLVDVQVILNNYKTSNIFIPSSSSAATTEKADVNWVLFGYPFEQVLSDSVFKQLGKIEKMEDGKWVVYEYNESVNEGFSLFNQATLNINKAYFIAQSVNENINLSYRYNNSVTTRKLSENIINLAAGKWKTIVNPYTFDVEIDTPAVLYRYDTQAKSYKLTNIMRPGEGYFVPPDVTELHMINYGEYYPVLFPKIISDSEWYLSIEATYNSQNDELLLVYNGNKILSDNLLYKKAPVLENGLDFSFIASDGSKYSSAVFSGTNSKYSIKLKTNQEATATLEFREVGQLPGGASFELVDESTGNLLDRERNTISSDSKITLLIGDVNYIKSELAKISSSGLHKFALDQNYPNPFNPETTINYSIPEKGLAKLTVYDILGRKVKVLVHELLEPGSYSAKFDAAGLSSGIYFYKIECNSFNLSKKMILLK